MFMCVLYNSASFRRTSVTAALTIMVFCGLLPVATGSARAQGHFGPGSPKAEKPTVRLYIEPSIYTTGSSSTDEQELELSKYSGITVHDTETDFSTVGMGTHPVTVAMGADFFISRVFFVGPHIGYGSTERKSKDHTNDERENSDSSTYNLMVQGGGLFALGNTVKGSIRGGISLLLGLSIYL